jgi:DNA repair photolyase
MALVGIARLASRSERLEAKRQVEYFEMPARSILNRTRPDAPFQWTINPYRGCEFACKYCYARYTHEFMEMSAAEFDDRIYAKAAPAELLRQELRRVAPGERIALGTATDPYQPAERRYLRTRALLTVLASENGRHLGITTKSDLITRDIDLLVEIARRNVLNVYLTITTLDEALARKLEPRAPRPALRLRAVEELSRAGIVAGVTPSPVMPGLTDSPRSLDRLAKASRHHGAQSFGEGVLFLMPSAQKVFFPFLEQRFPDLAARYRRLFAGGPYLGRDYKDELRALLGKIRDRYGLSPRPVEYRPELWIDDRQGNLFG